MFGGEENEKDEGPKVPDSDNDEDDNDGRSGSGTPPSGDKPGVDGEGGQPYL